MYFCIKWKSKTVPSQIKPQGWEMAQTYKNPTFRAFPGEVIGSNYYPGIPTFESPGQDLASNCSCLDPDMISTSEVEMTCVTESCLGLDGLQVVENTVETIETSTPNIPKCTGSIGFFSSSGNYLKTDLSTVTEIDLTTIWRKTGTSYFDRISGLYLTKTTTPSNGCPGSFILGLSSTQTSLGEFYLDSDSNFVTGTTTDMSNCKLAGWTDAEM